MPACFRDVAPEFAEGLVGLLLADDEPALAEQVLEAEVVARCRFSDDFCASFHTAPPPQEAYAPEHENVLFDPAVGMVVLDVADGRLMQVEVLHHDEFRLAIETAVL